MKEKRQRSFSRIISWVVVMAVVPMIALLVTTTFYSINHSNRLIRESNEMVVDLWGKQISENVNAISDIAASIAFIEPDFAVLGRDNSQLNVLQASYAVTKRMATTINGFPALGAMFLYSPNDSKWVEKWAEGYYTYDYRQKIRTVIRSADAKKLPSGIWTSLEAGTENVLCYCLRLDGASLIAMVDFDHLLSLNTEGSYLLYTDNQGRTLSGGPELKKSRREHYMTDAGGNVYLAVTEKLGNTGINLIYAVSESNYWAELTPFQIILTVLSLLTLCLIPLTKYIIQRNFGQPLGKLSQSMEKIAAGDVNIQLEGDYRSEELENVKQTFNLMMDRVQRLKIEVYENEIDRQKAELQYRHLQLRPHFFLNCLKNMYALAQQNRMNDIQEQVLAVSDYMRYLLRDNRTLVRLEEELRYADNYIRIQQLSHSCPPLIITDVDSELMDCLIPPLSVEAFVENAVKHRDVQGQLTIKVTGRKISAENGELMDITVRNNGGLFNETILIQLNSRSDTMEIAGHVGLSNLKHRLSLLYMDRADTAFYNEHGEAVCELICPIERSRDNESSDSR